MKTTLRQLKYMITGIFIALIVSATVYLLFAFVIETLNLFEWNMCAIIIYFATTIVLFLLSPSLFNKYYNKYLK